MSSSMETPAGPQGPKANFIPKPLPHRRNRGAIDRSEFEANYILEDRNVLVDRALKAIGKIPTGPEAKPSPLHEQTGVSAEKVEATRRKGHKDLENKLRSLLWLFGDDDDVAKVEYKELTTRWEARIWRNTQDEDGEEEEYNNNIDLELRELDEWNIAWSSPVDHGKTGEEVLRGRIYELFPEEFAQSQTVPQRNTSKASAPEVRFVPKTPKTRKGKNKVDTSEFWAPEYVALNHEAITAAVSADEAILNASTHHKGQLSKEDENRWQNRQLLREAIGELIKNLPKTDELVQLDVIQLAESRETAMWEGYDIFKYDTKITEELVDLDSWDLYWDSEYAGGRNGETGCDLFREYVHQHFVHDPKPTVEEGFHGQSKQSTEQSEPSEDHHEREEGRKLLETAIAEVVNLYASHDELSQIDVPKFAAAWEHQFWQKTYFGTVDFSEYITQIDFGECTELEMWRNFWDCPMSKGQTGQEVFRQHFENNFGSEYLISNSISQQVLDDELYDLAGGNDDNYYGAQEEDSMSSSSYHDSYHYGAQEGDGMSSNSYHGSDDGLFTGFLDDHNEETVESRTSPSPSQQGCNGTPIISYIEGDINDDNAPHYAFGAAPPSPLQVPQTIADDVSSDFSTPDGHTEDSTEGTAFARQELGNGSVEKTAANISHDLDTPLPDGRTNGLCQDQDNFCPTLPTDYASSHIEPADVMDFEHDTYGSNQVSPTDMYSTGDNQQPVLPTASAAYFLSDGEVEDIEMSGEDTSQHVWVSATVTIAQVGQTPFVQQNQETSASSNTDIDMLDSPKTTPEPPVPMFSVAGLESGKPVTGSVTPLQSRTVIDFGVNTANLSVLKRLPDGPRVISEMPTAQSQSLDAPQAEPKGSGDKAVHDDVGTTRYDEVIDEVHATGSEAAQTGIEQTKQEKESSAIDKLCSRIKTYQEEWDEASKNGGIPPVFLEYARALFTEYENRYHRNQYKEGSTDFSVLKRLEILNNKWETLRKTTDAFFHLSTNFLDQAQSTMQKVAKDFEENKNWAQDYMDIARQNRAVGNEALAKRWEALAAGRTQANQELLQIAKSRLDVMIEHHQKYYDALQDLHMHSLGLGDSLSETLGEMAKSSLAYSYGRIKEAHDKFNAPFEELSVDIFDCEL